MDYQVNPSITRAWSNKAVEINAMDILYDDGKAMTCARDEVPYWLERLGLI
jgi:hypothetical protein